MLPRIISPFRERFPHVELVLEEMNSVEIVRAIAARKVDVGLVRLPVMDTSPAEIEVIERDHLMVAVPENAMLESQLPLRQRRSVALIDLAAMPFIIYSAASILHATIRLACQRAGFSPLVAQEATQVQTILSLVQAGLGVALVPSRTARFAPKGVRVLPLAEPILIDMGIACAPDAGPLSRNFVTTALAACDSDPLSDQGN
jgi:DNA-binding transcriptional LysR family regulator